MGLVMGHPGDSAAVEERDSVYESVGRGLGR